MKERPILFNGEMVRAILDGRKTQTRRIVKPQPERRENQSLPWHYGSWFHGWNLEHRDVAPEFYWHKCPFGQPGDRLWVRETFRLFDSYYECACYDDCVCGRSHGKPIYRADGDDETRWTPSIHMPRWASRITLEITDLRVEQLQHISEDDARSEGCNAPLYLNDSRGRWGPPRGETLSSAFPSAKHWFSSLWESINGAGSWSANPWVWVVKFKKLDAEGV